MAWYYSRKLIFFVWLVFAVFCEGRFNSKYDTSNYLKLYLFNQIQLCILNLGSTRYLIITLTINQDKLFTFINHFETTYRLKSEVEIVSKEGGICLDKTSWQGPQKKSKKARNLCQTTALMHFNVHNSSYNRRSNSESSNIILHLKKIYSYIDVLWNSFLKFQIHPDYMHFQFDHCVNFASVLIKYATKVHWSYVKFRYDFN